MALTASVETLIAEAISGDRRALSRALSAAERGMLDIESASAIQAAAGTAYSIGLTGAPGAGKSTLTDALIAVERSAGRRIAVVAIDPSSPFSGGAILGDRVRLREQHVSDDGVFVRSLASRGQLGGLARAVPETVRVLDACGWPTILIETVGVGQTELAIIGSADTTVVVVNPGWGDEVQANKAGLLEAADVLVINKADRAGAAETRRDLVRMLALGSGEREWTPPVLATVATEGTGVDELWDAINAHRAALQASGELLRRRGERRVAEARDRLTEMLARMIAYAEATSEGQRLLEAAREGQLAPGAAAARLASLIVEVVR